MSTSKSISIRNIAILLFIITCILCLPWILMKSYITYNRFIDHEWNKKIALIIRKDIFPSSHTIQNTIGRPDSIYIENGNLNYLYNHYLITRFVKFKNDSLYAEGAYPNEVLNPLIIQLLLENTDNWN